MKKLFTLVAFLACFLGAKAEWVEVYNIDYSTYQGFPFYVMGYVPEWFDGVMTDFGANYKYVQVTDDAEETSDVIVKTQNGVEYYKIFVEGGAWHQYFIADGIPTQIDGSYKVKAMVKASAAVTINVNMGWGWGDGQQASASVAIGTDWQEVEWEYSGIAGSSCNLVAQPGGATATIEWKNLTVYENQKKVRPVEWIELISNGDAEKSWAEMGLGDVKFNDAENNYKICAWGKEREVNMNEDGGWDPFPATIEADPADASNKVFVVHGKAATTEGDASAWDNQFWIESTRAWKSGEQAKIKFRYKASKAVAVATQTHYQQPSSYLIWHAIGDINFTEDWQTFDQTVTFSDDMTGGWSVAFQLNQNDKDPIDFYFDDISWQEMKLDHGYFVAGCNTEDGTEYDLDNAIEFAEGTATDGSACLVATIGEKGAYVNQIMISTVRGNDAAFKGATLKPQGAILNDPDNWMEYTEQSLAKLTLPGVGIWKIYLDTEYKSIAFQMTEGTIKEPINVVTNTTEIIVKGVERDWLTADNDGNPREAEIGTGEAWDNQFWFVANRTLAKGEVTHLKFSYKANKEAKTTTQCHGNPGGYLHWAAIGDVTFNTEWQEFDADFTVPDAANDMQSIAFNMAEIKEACDYEIKDVQWYLKADGLDEGKTWENLIDATGTKNFYVKIGAGTEPYQYDGGSGINNITNNNKINSAVIYNLAGQRVSKDYKGIVVTNGKKVVNK
jgi:hypothetical protein